MGTGTGFNAGLLAALLGQDAVTTLDLAPSLTTQAQRNLKTAGYAPTVIEANAAAGWPPGAPYDRILATFSVDSFPDAWRGQVRPEGLIVTPWYSDWTAYGMLSLAVAADGAAQGRFHPQGSYMTMRTHHPAAQTPAAPGGAARHLGSGTAARASTPPSRTCLSPWAVSGDPDTEFHLGLTVPNTSYDWDTTGEHAPIRFALYSADGSVAAVDYDGQQAHEFTVTQIGRRRPGDETEAAYARWERFGRPGVERHGLTITPDSTHRVWIDDPKQRLHAIQQPAPARDRPRQRWVTLRDTHNFRRERPGLHGIRPRVVAAIEDGRPYSPTARDAGRPAQSAVCNPRADTKVGRWPRPRCPL